MNLYRAIIIDDEELACDDMERKLANIKLFEILGIFTSIAEAHYFLRTLTAPIDFIFCDIELGEISGLDGAALLKRYCSFFVCCTGYEQYALEAHKKLVDGFLVKPVDEALLLALVDKLQVHAGAIAQAPVRTIMLDQIPPPAERMQVGKKRRVLLQVAIDDIRYLKREGNYLCAYGVGKNNGFVPMGRVNISLKDFMSRFCQLQNIVQINKSEIVNMDHMTVYSDDSLTIEKQAFFVNGKGLKQMNMWLISHTPNCK